MASRFLFLSAGMNRFSHGFSAKNLGRNRPNMLFGVSTSNVLDLESKVLAKDKDFLKPDLDKREYLSIRLKNGLEALLVSAMDSDSEGASINVKAGHFNDPEDRKGLAHFHEHMLFLGTKKYPKEEEYEGYLSKNGGSSNAYTDMEDSNYFFSVSPHIVNGETSTKVSDALEGGLDRLAQFFISPSFDESAVEREMRAIDSEYANGISSDNWRQFQLLKNSANSLHPFHKFGCGNYETLTKKENPIKDLRKFWEDYYHSNNVKLCVVGKAPLNELRRVVEETFGSIRSGNVSNKKESNSDKLFRNENGSEKVAFTKHKNLGMIREVEPLLFQRSIKISFLTPPITDPFIEETRPHHLASHLLGHEGPNSLHAVLSELGLITGLATGTSIDTSEFSLFSLSVNLTLKGMQQRQVVLDYIFAWIHLVKSSSKIILQQYHEELQTMSKIIFKFREPSDPIAFASYASKQLFVYDNDPEKVLSGPSFYGAFNSTIFDAYMDRLSVSNSIITILLPTESCVEDSINTLLDKAPWQVEPWYKAKYRETSIPTNFSKPRSNINKELLKLPELNQFIPTDFSLKCDLEESPEQETNNPSLLVDTLQLRLWHKLDTAFRVPKTAIKFLITSPVVYMSPRTITLCRLFQRVLNDDLNSYVYDASIANCNYNVVSTPMGFQITVSGYSEKVPLLFEVVCKRILSILEMQNIKDATFQKAKESLLRETKNHLMDAPYEICNYNSRIIMEQPVWHVNQYLEILEQNSNITLKECYRAVKEAFCGNVKIECLCMGNINQKETLQIQNVLEELFLSKSQVLSDEELPSFCSLKLPTKQEAKKLLEKKEESHNCSNVPIIYEHVASSPAEENCAVELTLQVGCDFSLGYQGIVLLELLGYLAYNSAYAQLRTKEQLGYIVSAYVRKNTGGGRSLAILVQSNSALPFELEQRIENWLIIFRQELENLTLETLAMEANAIVAQLLERDLKLNDEISRTWSDIASTVLYSGKLKIPEFNRLSKLAKLLKQDESSTEKTKQLKSQLLEFFDGFIAQDASQRRIVSSRFYSQKYASLVDQNKMSQKSNTMFLFNETGVNELKQFLEKYPIAPYWA